MALPIVAFTTRHTWAAACDVTVGAATETFTNSLVADSIVDLMVAWVLWANAGARAWTGTRTFSWSWTTDPTEAGVIARFSATGGVFSITPTAAFTTVTGFQANAAVTMAEADSFAAGGWAPDRLRAAEYYRRIAPAGDGCGNGAVRGGAPGLAGFHPTVEALSGPVNTAKLLQRLAMATVVRRIWVYQAHTDSLLFLSLGDVTPEPVAGATIYRIAFQVAGEAL